MKYLCIDCKYHIRLEFYCKKEVPTDEYSVITGEREITWFQCSYANRNLNCKYFEPKFFKRRKYKRG